MMDGRSVLLSLLLLVVVVVVVVAVGVVTGVLVFRAMRPFLERPTGSAGKSDAENSSSSDG